MNLPRHTLTSHGPEPVFVNAQFSRAPHSAESQAGKESYDSARTRKQKRHGRERHGERGARISQDVAGPNIGAAKGKEKEKAESLVRTHFHDQKSMPSQVDSSSSRSAAKQGSVALLTCATRSGFFVANADPIHVKARRDFPSRQGGLSHACVIDGTSLVALVGGGRVPRFAPNKVVLWDETASVRTLSFHQAAKTTSSHAAGTTFQERDDDSSSVASTIFSLSQEDSSSELDGEEASSVPSGLPEDEDEPDRTTSEGLDSSHLNSAESVILPGEEEDKAQKALQREKVPVISASLASRELQQESSEAEMQPAEDIVGSLDDAKQSTSTGAVVAELEFGEAVRNIEVGTFALEETRHPAEESEMATAEPQKRATILLVTLQRRIVVFEMGVHLPQSEATSEWSILQRVVIEIHPDTTKCAPTMAKVPRTNCVLLAMPGRQCGHVQLLCLSLSNASHTSLDSSIGGSSSIIAAHSSSLACMKLSDDSQLLCTASERGTLLRLWSIQFARRTDAQRRSAKLQPELIGELRRGSSPATIMSIAMDFDFSLLAAASDRGTIHFFDIADLQTFLKASPGQDGNNSRLRDGSRTAIAATNTNKLLPSALRGFASSLPANVTPQYLRSQWSFAQYRIPLQVFSHRAAEGGRQFEEHTPPMRQRKSNRQTSESKSVEQELAAAVGDAIVPAPPQKLEGGWDAMRGRIEDIRRGEKSVEERMWLAWTPARSESRMSDDDQDEGQGKDDRGPAGPYQLLAVTSSGSHFRIAVRSGREDKNDTMSSGEAGNTSQSVVLNMYRSDSSSRRGRAQGQTAKDMALPSDSSVADSSSAKTSTRGACWLIEHSRFGTRDPWID